MRTYRGEVKTSNGRWAVLCQTDSAAAALDWYDMKTEQFPDTAYRVVEVTELVLTETGQVSED